MSLFNPILTTIAIVSFLSTPSLSMDPPEQETPMDIEIPHTFPIFIKLPLEIQGIVIEKYIFGEDFLDLIKSEGHLGKFGSVCKNWYKHITTPRPSQLSFYKEPHSLEMACILELYHNIFLRYYPSNESQFIDLHVSEFKSPLHGQFNLNNCGDTEKFFKIGKGYKTHIIPENKGKYEIWLLLRSEAQKIDHFKELFDKKRWPKSAPVGLIFCWNEYEPKDFTWYLTTQNLNSLSTDNLFTKWCAVKMRELPYHLRSTNMTTPNRGSLLGVQFHL